VTAEIAARRADVPKDGEEEPLAPLFEEGEPFAVEVLTDNYSLQFSNLREASFELQQK